MDVHTGAEDTSSLELLFPGCYSNVCLSIQVKDLAVNSIMQAALVNELEGSGGTAAFDSTGHTIDEYSKGETQSAVTLGDSALATAIFAELKEWSNRGKLTPPSPAPHGMPSTMLGVGWAPDWPTCMIQVFTALYMSS